MKPDKLIAPPDPAHFAGRPMDDARDTLLLLSSDR
jgi:hypothetical protein